MEVEQSNHSLTFHKPSKEQSIGFITALQDSPLCLSISTNVATNISSKANWSSGNHSMLARPPIMAMRGPVVPTIIRRPINTITPAEKPMTTVYVSKIASSVDNEFMLSLLQIYGPVKSWKHVPDPTTGAFKGFGFCEFIYVEGVLHALRLLSKLSIDGQELMLNFDNANKEYLKSYVEKKKENLKNTEGSFLFDLNTFSIM
ncbi:hypothetical protein Lser_V15G22411 [Lactuca serriola]